MGGLRISARGLAVVAAGLAALALGTPARASQALAADLGCMNCHGDPPRKQAPTFAALALQYAPARDDAARQAMLTEKLRQGSIFSHIDAHERLSPETAARLVRWITEGAQ